jgi:hypothetical protein
MSEEHWTPASAGGRHVPSWHESPDAHASCAQHGSLEPPHACASLTTSRATSFDASGALDETGELEHEVNPNAKNSAVDDAALFIWETAARRPW